MDPSPLAAAPAPPKPRRRRWRAKLAAILLALLFSFVVCEVAARVVFPAPPDPTREPQIVYVYSQEVGYLHLPNQRGWIDDGFVTINSLGFRGAEPKTPKPEGLFRLLVIGSSNTAGWGVHDDQTYCAELERQLPALLPGRPVEVLNWSVSGYKMDHKERLLRRYGLGLRPDLLLIDFSDYDLFAPDETPRADADATPEGVSEGSTLSIPHTGKTFQLLNAPSWINRVLRKSRAIYCAKNGLYGLKVLLAGSEPRAANELALLEGNDSPAVEEAWKKVEESLERIGRLTADLRGRVGLLIFPVREQVAKRYPQAQYQERLKAAAARHGFFVVDPLARFRDHPTRLNELYIPYDRGHPGPLGHRLIADEIVESVRERCELAR